MSPIFFIILPLSLKIKIQLIILFSHTCVILKLGLFVGSERNKKHNKSCVSPTQKSSWFLTPVLITCKSSKHVHSLWRDRKHYVQFLLLFPSLQRNSQPCERVTPRVSHLAIKSHSLAWSLLQSSLGSQPLSTLYPYLRQWCQPEKALTWCFRQLRLCSWIEITEPREGWGFQKKISWSSVFYLFLQFQVNYIFLHLESLFLQFLWMQ